MEELYYKLEHPSSCGDFKRLALAAHSGFCAIQDWL